LQTVLAEASLLTAATEPTSTLLVAPRCRELLQFSPAFLSFLRLAETQLDSSSLQLVGFHPLYRFEGEEEGDAAAYTNRSPWPTIHLLRQSDVSSALADSPDAGEAVPQRNAALLRGVGAAALEEELCALRDRALKEALTGRMVIGV
jgi:hypothetical protein